MATRCRYPIILALALGALVLWSQPAASGQAQAVELPPEVRTWMQRDQVVRWSKLIETGGKLFNEGSCANCHGDNGSGGRWAPDLTDTEWVQSDGDLEGIRETIFWGVRRSNFADPDRRFQMHPAGGQDLEWGEYDALAASVWSLSNGTFLPER